VVPTTDADGASSGGGRQEGEEAENFDAELNEVDMGDMSNYIRPHHEAAEREMIWVCESYLKASTEDPDYHLLEN